MLAEQVRSGLAETRHEGAVAVVGRDGALVASFGDIDRPFFLRSSAKPFQAAISQESGADLSRLEMAMACASHRGFPVHIALVDSMLHRASIDQSALGCPPDWPLAPSARDLVHRSGASGKRRIWHNCSGKHAAFLRACVGSGWPLDSYLSPDHPLQRRIIDFATELGEYPAGPVGVDGCGAPVLRTTTRAMGLMFARLATETRLSPAFDAMHRYPALVGANGECDTEIAIATNSVAKGGAAGCLGIAVEGRIGIAVKSWDGLVPVAGIGAVETMRWLGELTPTGFAALESVLRPEVLGGGAPVGAFEPRLTLEPA
ncbi:MAG TPA: asparaginase [Acidimicrobiia bacterium]|nr:asparaginase [Acidimicrobiia bacterium]